ncbi:PREDICTED: uncharacterized protein LOC105557100 [Vollenhovia emeryi]|uniref:uncharacterized protein LOC105557100 n=1 Tax=Vollenhovia emeryi TaxID=411798 RepID=UPI0005F3B588|nr:PREDICTED: uncharacterized protein LOC105557100 [Vollenhovia emeryi]
MKRRTSVQHQHGCVQTSKPLTIEEIQTTAKSQEMDTEQIDEMQPADENGNLLRSIIKENEQLRNEIKENLEQVVNIDRKTEKIDTHVYREVCKENDELKQQVKVLGERVQLAQKVLAEDQWKALNTDCEHSKGLRWSQETVLKALSLRFTCGTTGYNHIRDVVAPFPSVRTLQRRIENISFEPGILSDIFLLLKEMVEHLDKIHKFCCLVFDEMSIQEKIDFDPNSNAYITIYHSTRCISDNSI